jgi:hypothetical protein
MNDRTEQKMDKLIVDLTGAEMFVKLEKAAQTKRQTKIAA